MTVEIELGANLPEEDRTVITEEGIVNHNPIKTHTGKADFTSTVKGDSDLEIFAQRQDRINVSYENGTEWTGYLTGVSHDTNRGTTRLRADGVEKRLEETRPDYEAIGGPVTYSNIALHDALKDYWPRTPFQNVTVTEQDTELVAEDEQVQDADTTTEWENHVSISDTDPFYIENGELRLAQSCFVHDLGVAVGENGISSQSDTSPVTDSEYSNGEGRTYDSISSETLSVPWTVNYTWPGDEINIAVRSESDNDSAVLSMAIVDSDASEVGSVEIHNGSGKSLFWTDSTDDLFVGDWTDGDIEPGDYQLEITVDDSQSNPTNLDLVAVLDNRFNYTFDNDNGGNGGYLDGPALYPDEATIQLDPTTTSYNITAGSLTSTWDDTTGPQGLGLSNDGGEDFQRTSNAETLDVTFGDAGREIVVETTFGKYGSRTDATPQEGHLGQSIDSYSLSIDGNDLVVIADMELTRNHFDNLDKLHNYGDFLYVVEHGSGPIDELVVSSFRRGEETRDAPYAFQNPKNQQPEIQSGTYYNSIYLEGGLREDGTRPSAEVKDQDAIDRDGREISPGVLRDTDISTEAGAQFRARALLDTAQSNNDLVGSVTTPPLMTSPGYARPIDMGDGLEYKTVEEVSLTLGNNSAEATSDFSVRTGFSEEIGSLKRSNRELGNQV